MFNELRRMWKSYCLGRAIRNYNAALTLHEIGKGHLASICNWKGDVWIALLGDDA